MRTDAALVSAQSRSKRLANAYRRVAPSINAASSKSRGMVTMYERSRKVENVANRAAWMIMTPTRLLISPSCYGRSGSVCVAGRTARHPGGDHNRPDNRWGYGMIRPQEALSALSSYRRPAGLDSGG